MEYLYKLMSVFTAVRVRVFLAGVLSFLFVSQSALGQSHFSRAATAWSTATTWSAACSGATGPAVPVAASTVSICNAAHTVLTSAANVQASTLTITAGSYTQSGAFSITIPTVNISGGTMTISNTVASTFATGITVSTGAFNTSATTVSAGALTINGGTFTITGGTFTVSSLTINAGTLNLNGGTLVVTGDVSGTGGTITGTTGIMNVGGAWTHTGTFTAGSTTINFNGTGAQTIPARNFYNLTISGARGANNVTLVNGGTIGVSNIFSPTATFAGGAFVTTGNTFNFNGAAQNVPAFTYNNLQISGSGIKTVLTPGITSNGTLTTSGTATLATTTLNITVNGLTTIGAGTSITHTTAGTKSFAAITSNGIWTAGGAAVSISGNLTVNTGSTFTSGAGMYTFSGTGTTIGGTLAAISITNATITGTVSSAHAGLTITNLAVNSPGTFTNTGTLASAAITSNGTYTNSTNGTLNFSGASIAVTNFAASANPNTVQYTAATATVRTATYHHLIISGAGTKSCNGNNTINGNLTVNTGAILHDQGNGITGPGSGSGTFSLVGTGTFTTQTTNPTPMPVFQTYSFPTTSFVNYIGAADQTVTAATYGNLTVTNNIKTISNATTVSTLLTVSAASTLANNSTLTCSAAVTSNGSLSNTSTINIAGQLTVAGTFTNTGTANITGTAFQINGLGTITNSTNGILNIASTIVIPTLDAIAADNTVVYNLNANQTPKATTYYNLTINKTGGTCQPVAGTTTVTNVLSMQSALNMSARTLTLNGTVTGAAALSSNGTTTLNIGGTSGGNVGTLNLNAGAQTLGTFTINRTGANPSVTFNGVPTINTAFTLTSGVVNMGTQNVFYAGGTASMSASAGNANSYFAFSSSSTAGFQWNMPASTVAGTYRWPVGPAATVNGFRPVTIQTTANNGVAISQVKVGFINHDGSAYATATNVLDASPTDVRANYIANITVANQGLSGSPNITMAYQNGDFNSAPSSATIWYYTTAGGWTNSTPNTSGSADGNTTITKAAIFTMPIGTYSLVPAEIITTTGANTWNWIGVTSTSWNVASNWAPATVPNAITANVIISNASAPFQPTLNQNNSVNNLTVGSGETLSLSTFNLTVYGSVVNTATIIPNSSTVTFAALTPNIQTLDIGTSTLNTVTHSGTGTLQLVNNDLTLNAGALFTNSAGVLDLNGENLTVGDITGAGTIENTSSTASLLTTGSANGTQTYAGSINNTGSGNLSIVKNGSGVWTLTGNNSYKGSTTINGTGAINIQHANALGATSNGTVVSNGAALQIQNNITVGAEALTLNGAGIGGANGALNSVSGSNTWGGTITLASNGTIQSSTAATTLTLSAANAVTGNFNLTFQGAGNGSINGTITTGAGAVTKTGTGTLILSGANTYTGATAVNQGVLNIQNNTATGTTAGGVTVANLAALQMQGGISVGAEALTLNGAGISSNGSLRSISGNNTWGGTITLSTNPVVIQSDANTLTLSAANSITATNIGLTLTGAGNGVVSGTITTGTGGLTKALAGTWTLSGANTYTGITAINAGTLSVATINNGGVAGNIGQATNAAANLVLGGGRLLYTGATASTDRAFTLTAATTSTIDISTAATTLTITGAGAATTGALIKAGTGTLTLSGNSAYSGLTTISAGTLKLGSAGSGANTPLGTTGSATTVNSGATLDLNGFSLITAEPLNLNGTGVSSNGALTNTSATAATYTGAITLQSASTINASNGTITISGTGNVTGAFPLSLEGTSNGVISKIIATGAGSVIKNGTGTWTLQAANTYTGGTVLNTGQLNINNNTALGTGAFTIAGGTVIDNTLGSAVTLGAIAQNWNGDFSFTGSNDLNIGTGTVTMSASRTLTSNGTGVLTVGGVINHNTLDLTKAGTGTLSFNSSANAKTLRALTISDGTLIGPLGNINLTGDFTSNGTFTASTSTVVMNGGVAQTIGGTSTTTFNNLTISNTSTGVTLASPANVTGIFALTGTGKLITTATNILSVTNNAAAAVTNIGAPNSFVIGPMNRTLLAGATPYLYPVADESSNYRPFELINPVVTTGAVVRVTVSETGATTGDGTTMDAALLSGRNWRMQTISGTFTSTTLRITESGLGSMSVIGRATPNVNSNYISVGGNSVGGGTITSNTGVTSNAYFAIGAAPCPGYWVGGTSNNWALPANWCDNAVPTATTNVVIPFPRTFYPATLSAGVMECNNITINAGASVTVPAATNFTVNGNLSSNGTLTQSTGTIFVTGNFNNTGTFTAGTGTVDFVAPSGLQTVNRGGSTFYNLTHSGAGTLRQVTTGLNVTNILNNSGGGLIDMANIAMTAGDIRGNGTIRNVTTSTATRIITVGGANLTSTFSGTIENNNATQGLVAVTKNGTGIWTLTGNNTYTGATLINVGGINIQHNSALGTADNGTTVANTAALQIQGNITVAAEPLTLNGAGIGSANGALRSISGTNEWGGTITLASNGTIQSDAGTLDLTNNIGGAFALTLRGASGGEVSGQIGTASLVKNDAGTWILSGDNTYAGATTVTLGVLRLKHNNALGTTAAGTTVASTAALHIDGSLLVIPEAITLSGTGNPANTGVLRNLANNNTCSGLLTLGAASRINSDNGTLSITNAGTITGATFGLTVGGAGNTTINSIIGTTTGTLTKVDNGTLILTGANTYTGTSSINAGIVNIRNATALGSATGGAATVANLAQLQMQNNITVAATKPLFLNGDGISSNGSLQNVSGNNTWGGTITLSTNSVIESVAGTLTINNGTSAITGAGTLTVQGAGNTTVSGLVTAGFTGTLTKNGTGILTMSGANAFTGTKTLNDGTLRINSNNALGASGIFTITNGTIANTSGVAVTTPTYTNNWNGDFSFTGTSDLTLNGAVTINASPRTVTITQNTLTIPGTVSNATRDLVKAGAGTLAFVASAVTLRDLTISEGTLTSTSGTLDIRSDFSNSATFNHNNGTVLFSNNAAQTIVGSSVTDFYNMTVNKGAGTVVTMTPNANVANTLTLTSGLVNTRTNNAVLTVTNTSVTAISGGSATAYVVGPISRAIVGGTNTWVFPVGETDYNFFELLNPAITGTAVVSAEYFDNPSYGGTPGAPLSALGDKRWKALVTSGAITNLTAGGVRLNQVSGPFNAIQRIGQSAPASPGGTYAFRGGAPNGIDQFITSNSTVANTLGHFAIATNGHFSGTVTVGTNQEFPSLTNADGLFQAINLAGLCGNVTARIMTGITGETGTHALNQWTEYTDCIGMTTVAPSKTLTILAGVNSNMTITGSYSNATNPGLFRLDGADRVTFDGRFNGAGTTTRLFFTNSNATTNTNNSCFNLLNDATNNTFQYLGVRGRSKTAGVFRISEGASTGVGNDNITIDNCIIQNENSALANFPGHGIVSAGRNASSRENSNLTITNNRILNFLASNGTSAGIFIDNGGFARGTTNATITGNSIYQATNLTGITNDVNLHGIYINHTSGSGFTIEDNYIGGNTVQAGGSEWIQEGGNNSFRGIYVRAGSTTSIQNNTIKNININTSSPLENAGIYIDDGSGNANIGNVTGNTIGQANTTNSITLQKDNGSSLGFTGIAIKGTGTYNTSNNRVSGISVNATPAARPSEISKADMDAATSTTTSVLYTGRFTGTNQTSASGRDYGYYVSAANPIATAGGFGLTQDITNTNYTNLNLLGNYYWGIPIDIGAPYFKGDNSGPPPSDPLSANPCSSTDVLTYNASLSNLPQGKIVFNRNTIFKGYLASNGNATDIPVTIRLTIQVTRPDGTTNVGLTLNNATLSDRIILAPLNSNGLKVKYTVEGILTGTINFMYNTSGNLNLYDTNPATTLTQGTLAAGPYYPAVWLYDYINTNPSFNICHGYTWNFYTDNKGGALTGISTTAGTNTIAANKIDSLFSASTLGGLAATSAIIGIQQNSATANQTIARNTIHSLTSTATTPVNIIGVQYAGATTGTNVIERNFIHSFSSTTHGTGHTGIWSSNGTATIRNNMIRLGINRGSASITSSAAITGIYGNSSTNSSNLSIFNNSIYIGGATVSGGANNTYAVRRNSTGTNTFDIRNNIFMNARSGTGKHYSVYLDNITGVTTNYNILYGAGTGYQTGFLTSDRTSFANWQAATTQEANSPTPADPKFIAPTAGLPDLHIDTVTVPVATAYPVSIAEGNGQQQLVIDDFDGEIRDVSLPFRYFHEIGADEFCVKMRTTGSNPADNVCAYPATAISFTVNQEGSRGQTFQWQVSSNGGTTWTDLANGGIYSNVTTATMGISAAGVPTVIGYQYRCVINNKCSSTTSNVATVHGYLNGTGNTITWTSGANTTNWHTVNNWDCRIPLVSDNVIVPDPPIYNSSSPIYPVILPNAIGNSYTISLEGNSTLEIQGTTPNAGILNVTQP